MTSIKISLTLPHALSYFLQYKISIFIKIGIGIILESPHRQMIDITREKFITNQKKKKKLK